MNIIVKLIVTRVLAKIRSELANYVEQTDTELDDKVFDFLDAILAKVESPFAGPGPAAEADPMDPFARACACDFAEIDPDELDAE
jgi:hypothetical protein